MELRFPQMQFGLITTLYRFENQSCTPIVFDHYSTVGEPTLFASVRQEK
jgi:hypothetical protein